MCSSDLKMWVDPPLEFERVKVLKDSPISEISQRCQVSTKEIAYYNPALTDRVISGKSRVPSGVLLRVPVGSRELCARSKRSLTRNSQSSPAQITTFQLNSNS